jgi:hypothetical protein
MERVLLKFIFGFEFMQDCDLKSYILQKHSV